MPARNAARCQVRQSKEIQAPVLDIDRCGVHGGDRRRRLARGLRPVDRFRQDGNVAARDHDIAEFDRRTGRVGGKCRLLDQGIDLALLVAGRIGSGGNRDRRIRHRQRGRDRRRRLSAQRRQLADDLLEGIEAEEDGVLDLLVIVADDRIEMARICHQLHRERIGAGRRQYRRCRAECNRDGLVVVDAGRDHAIEMGGGAAVRMRVVIVVRSAERRQIRVVVGPRARRADKAPGRAERDIGCAENLGAAGQGQGSIVLGARRAPEYAGGRNQCVVVDDSGGTGGQVAEHAAVAGLAGVNADGAPCLDRGVAADIHRLGRSERRVRACAGAGDDTVEVGIGVVARRHRRRRADVECAGTEQLGRVDRDRDGGRRRQIGCGAAACEQAAGGHVDGIGGVYRVEGFDPELGGRTIGIVVEAEDGPAVDLGIDRLGDGAVAHGGCTDKDAARSGARAAAGLVHDVVGDDEHVSARGIYDQVGSDLRGRGRRHLVGRVAAAGAGDGRLEGVAGPVVVRDVLGLDVQPAGIQSVDRRIALQRRQRGGVRLGQAGRRGAGNDAAAAGLRERGVAVGSRGADLQDSKPARSGNCARVEPGLGIRVGGRLGDRCAHADIAGGDAARLRILPAVVFSADHHVAARQRNARPAIGLDRRTVRGPGIAALEADQSSANCCNRSSLDVIAAGGHELHRGDGKGAAGERRIVADIGGDRDRGIADGNGKSERAGGDDETLGIGGNIRGGRSRYQRPDPGGRGGDRGIVSDLGEDGRVFFCGRG